MIFMNSEIHEIDLEALFFRNFQNPNDTNSDLQGKMCFAKEYLPQGRTDSTEINF